VTDGQPATEDAFLESLTDTALYSIGAAFADNHPDLVDQAIEQSLAMERRGLAAWAASEGVDLQAAFETLVAGLALRYYRALTG
jgi:hypothetical protein